MKSLKHIQYIKNQTAVRITMSCFNPADEYWYPVTFDENGRTVQDFRNNLYTGAHEDDGVEVPDFKPELFEHDLSFNESNCLYSDGYKHAVITIVTCNPVYD